MSDKFWKVRSKVVEQNGVFGLNISTVIQRFQKCSNQDKKPLINIWSSEPIALLQLFFLIACAVLSSCVLGISKHLPVIVEPLQPCLNLPTSLAFILTYLQVLSFPTALPNALLIPSSSALCCADSTWTPHSTSLGEAVYREACK